MVECEEYRGEYFCWGGEFFGFGEEFVGLKLEKKWFVGVRGEELL